MSTTANNETLERIKKEGWKDIPGFEGFYQASNIGRIRSLTRYYTDRSGRQAYRTGKVLSPGLNPSGYFGVKLYKNYESKMHRIHRLVAIAWIINQCNFRVVNHIDGNKQNNTIENLEWCTDSYNQIHAYQIGLR